MNFSKEELSKAFNQVFTERAPDLCDIPDHVFSERFEQRMEKMIKREAAHPWVVSHTTARNVLIAALIAILLFVLSMSVSGIRNALDNFFVRHFDTHDDVIFDDTERTQIEHVYEITALPDGFELKNITDDPKIHTVLYGSVKGESILFIQSIPSENGETSTDNERTKMSLLDYANQLLFYISSDNGLTLAWEKDGYEFWIEISISSFSMDEAIRLYSSIQ